MISYGVFLYNVFCRNFAKPPIRVLKLVKSEKLGYVLYNVFCSNFYKNGNTCAKKLAR